MFPSVAVEKKERFVQMEINDPSLDTCTLDGGANGSSLGDHARVVNVCVIAPAYNFQDSLIQENIFDKYTYEFGEVNMKLL